MPPPGESAIYLLPLLPLLNISHPLFVYLILEIISTDIKWLGLKSYFIEIASRLNNSSEKQSVIALTSDVL